MDSSRQPPFSTSGNPSDALPHYTTSQVGSSNPPPISDKAPHAENNLNHKPASTADPAQYPPSHPPDPRLLHVYKNSRLSRTRTILAPDKITTAYTIHFNRGTLFSSKPDMEIYRSVPHPTNPGPPIGTVTFHRRNRDIDLTLSDRRVTISRHGVFRSKFEF